MFVPLFFLSAIAASVVLAADEDIASWSSADVDKWMQTILPVSEASRSYRASFLENDIDGTVLSDLSLSDLVDLKVSSLGHRKRIIKAIEALGGVETAARDSIPDPAAEQVPASVLANMAEMKASMTGGSSATCGDIGSCSQSSHVVEGQVLSTRPRVYLFPNFITGKQADDLIAMSSIHLTQSKVGIGSTEVKDSIRRSTSVFLNVSAEVKALLACCLHVVCLHFCFAMFVFPARRAAAVPKSCSSYSETTFLPLRALVQPQSRT